MVTSFSRRGFLGLASVLPFSISSQPSSAAPVATGFPQHEPDTVKEIVTVAHGNLARVKELVAARPALARASWDWGYGDWETPIDAASHVGNRPIAEFLVANGARPTVFTAVMMGQLALVKGLVEATPGIQRTRGPHGLTFVAHARAGAAGAAEVLKYLEALGDADPRYTDLPLTDAEQAAIVGEYAFGGGATERLKITKGPRGFTISRPGFAERNLFHQGGLVFNPAGAEAVKIRVERTSGSASAVVVEDGPGTTRAMRSAGSQLR
jgi:hypothetical protein